MTQLISSGMTAEFEDGGEKHTGNSTIDRDARPTK